MPIADQKIERVGDIMIEGNIEYRFPVYKIFTGALFYDIGNIWLLKENETFPGGKFNFDNFIGQLAMDIGIGIRLDFNYFIFRVDVAQKLRDPALTSSDRWVIGSGGDWFKVVWNLGIGYPFNFQKMTQEKFFKLLMSRFPYQPTMVNNFTTRLTEFIYSQYRKPAVPI